MDPMGYALSTNQDFRIQGSTPSGFELFLQFMEEKSTGMFSGGVCLTPRITGPCDFEGVGCFFLPGSGISRPSVLIP